MFNPFAKNSESVKNNGHMNPKAATQLHLRISEIRDNTVVLKNGGLRAVLKVSSINFNLKSEDEQNAIIYSYQAFLNTLEFPVQVVIRSRKLDLDTYIEKLRKMGEKQSNTLLQRQTYEYIEYVQRLIEYADIMEKEFYVVIPMDPARASKPSFVQSFWDRMHPAETIGAIMKKHQEFEQLKKTLTQRVLTSSTALENCGLKVEQLKTTELIAMFYQIFNPMTARNEKVEDTAQTTIQSEAQLGH